MGRATTKGIPHTGWFNAGLTDEWLTKTYIPEICVEAFYGLLTFNNTYFNYNRSMTGGLIMNTELATGGKEGSGLLQLEFRAMKQLYELDPSRVIFWEEFPSGSGLFIKSDLKKHPL